MSAVWLLPPETHLIFSRALRLRGVRSIGSAAEDLLQAAEPRDRSDPEINSDLNGGQS